MLGLILDVAILLNQSVLTSLASIYAPSSLIDVLLYLLFLANSFLNLRSLIQFVNATPVPYNGTTLRTSG